MLLEAAERRANVTLVKRERGRDGRENVIRAIYETSAYVGQERKGQGPRRRRHMRPTCVSQPKMAWSKVKEGRKKEKRTKTTYILISRRISH
jgi:hypothetical protein